MRFCEIQLYLIFLNSFQSNSWCLIFATEVGSLLAPALASATAAYDASVIAIVFIAVVEIWKVTAFVMVFSFVISTEASAEVFFSATAFYPSWTWAGPLISQWLERACTFLVATGSAHYFLQLILT